MIEVNAVFNEQRVKDMAKGKRIGNYVLFPLLAVVMLAGGIATIVGGAKGMDLVLGIILLIAAPIVLFLTFYMTRSETKNNIESFGVSEGEVVMNYKFLADGIAITRTANGNTDKEALRYSDLYKVKKTKKCFYIFVNKDEMFYLPCDSFISGTPDELFKLLYDKKVILDY